MTWTLVYIDRHTWTWIPEPVTLEDTVMIVRNVSDEDHAQIGGSSGLAEEFVMNHDHTHVYITQDGVEAVQVTA
jgi:hypothetical protein